MSIAPPLSSVPKNGTAKFREYGFYPHPKIHATIARFYMMTQTSLSAATRTSPKAQRVYSAPQRCLEGASILAHDAEGVQWHRHSCLCAVAKPITKRIAEAALTLPSKFLIANPRLTLRINHIRISDLKISNRKFSTIFRPEFSLFSSVEPQASSFQNLIETPRLKLKISPILSSISNFLIETKTAFSLILSPKTRIQCGREGDSA
jgi:hypothetical protein